MGLFSNLLGVAAAPFTGGASLAPMLIGAGVGAAKHFAIDKPAENRSRQMNSEIMRYSPWTGMQAPGVKEAGGLFSSALQGAALGNMVGGAGGLLGNGTSAAAGAANAGTAPLAAGAAGVPKIANPLAGAAQMGPMAQGASPWFNVQNPMYPYSK